MSDRIGGNGGEGPAASDVQPGAGAGGSQPRSDRRPVGTVIASVVEGTRALVRKHVELAKIEATEAVSARAMGGGMMAAAGVVGLFALGFAAAAASAALDIVLPTWAALLIVAGVLIAVAGALVLVGRHAIRTAPTTSKRTQETLKEDARWAKQQLAR